MLSFLPQESQLQHSFYWFGMQCIILSLADSEMLHLFVKGNPQSKVILKCMETQGNIPTRHLISSVITQSLKYISFLMFPTCSRQPTTVDPTHLVIYGVELFG